jgi:hypothetical protein
MYATIASSSAGAIPAVRQKRGKLRRDPVPRRPVVLQHAREHLLREHVVRRGRRLHRLHVPARPQVDDGQRPQERRVARGQEQAVARGAGAAAGAADALKERGDRVRRVHLDHPVQVAHVDPQLQRSRGDDHAVRPLRERRLGLQPLVAAERAVRGVRPHAQQPQLGGERLHLAAAVAEDQPFFPRVQPGDDERGVGQLAHEVHLHVHLGHTRRRAGHHLPGLVAAGGEPAEQPGGVGQGGGEADPLHRRTGQPPEPLQQGQQVPPAVVPGQRVDLVHHHGAQAGEEAAVVHQPRHQHHLHRLRRGEQDVGGRRASSAGARRWRRRRARRRRRPNRPVSRCSRGSRSFRRALMGQRYSTPGDGLLLVRHGQKVRRP